MKWLIVIGVAFIALACCVFGYIVLIRWLFGHLPELGLWLFWAKLGIVIGVFWCTKQITVLIISPIATVIAKVVKELIC